MGIEENKKTVLAFIEAFGRAEVDQSLLCEDAVWWIPGRGFIDRATFIGIVDKVNSLFVAPPAMKVTAVTAEGDRVAVEAEARADLKDGRVYANTYHFLFYLRDGRIREAREHNNSAVPAALFANSQLIA
jgi:ketosteroid isomerase-like protein